MQTNRISLQAMTNLSISIIIPLYNGSKLINRCLDSVYNQIGNFQLDVIVIDDGSTDNSINVVENYPQKITILTQKNSGPAAARNKGIEVATGKYLAFLDGDDYWLEEFLIKTITFMETHPTVAVSVGQIHKRIGKQDTIFPEIINSKSGRKSKSELIIDFFDFWSKHNHICTGSVLMKTDIVKITGGQRPELRITEDLEFWAYLATFGSWGFIPEILFISDGEKVTRDLGWIEKMKRRWENAPTVEVWEKRIVDRINKPYSAGYLKSRGLIARNLCYSQLLSGRRELSRKQVQKYGADFPNDKIAKILKFASKNAFLWNLISSTFIYREYHR